MLPVKFRRIPFSGFRREVGNVSANQRPGSHFVFFPIDPKKTPQNWYRTLGSSFLSSSVEFHPTLSEKKSSKSQPIRGRAAIFFFTIVPKKTNLVEDIKIFLPVKFREFHLAVSENIYTIIYERTL